MGPGIGVRSDDLRSHAGHLDAIATEIETARQAGEATRPGPDAYGKLCTIVPALLEQLQTPLVDGIREARDSVRDSAETVRVIAEAYDASDDRGAGYFPGGG